MAESVVYSVLLQLAIILFSARIAGYIFERLGQSKVLGELLVGLLLGKSILGLIDVENETIVFIAEIGIIMLLFEAGIESNLHELLKTGFRSFAVALIGVIAPLFAGMYYAVLLGFDSTTAFFIGATLTATSVGLTIRILKDMDKLRSLEGKIILGAAVIDDIIGLILLSILVDMVNVGGIVPANILKVTAIAISFLAVVFVVGRKLEYRIVDVVHRMKVNRTFIVTAFIFALILSYAANFIGLATIVGAFAAGLILEREEHKEHIFERSMF